MFFLDAPDVVQLFSVTSRSESRAESINSNLNQRFFSLDRPARSHGNNDPQWEWAKRTEHRAHPHTVLSSGVVVLQSTKTIFGRLDAPSVLEIVFLPYLFSRVNINLHQCDQTCFPNEFSLPDFWACRGFGSCIFCIGEQMKRAMIKAF